MTKLEQVAAYFDCEAEADNDRREQHTAYAAAIREAMKPDRFAIKEAFFAGFAAARAVNVTNAWEETKVRHAIDYPARAILNSNPEGSSDAE